jgi:hypothetical protein
MGARRRILHAIPAGCMPLPVISPKLNYGRNVLVL